jgi:hypothetical protein
MLSDFEKIIVGAVKESLEVGVCDFGRATVATLIEIIERQEEEADADSQGSR